MKNFKILALSALALINVTSSHAALNCDLSIQPVVKSTEIIATIQNKEQLVDLIVRYNPTKKLPRTDTLDTYYRYLNFDYDGGIDSSYSDVILNNCMTAIRTLFPQDIIYDGGGSNFIAEHFACEIEGLPGGKYYYTINQVKRKYERMSLQQISNIKCEKLQNCALKAQTADDFKEINNLALNLGCE